MSTNHNYVHQRLSSSNEDERGKRGVKQLTLQPDSESGREATNTELPDLLVELGVDTDVLDTHGLLRKLLHLLDSLGRPLLELDVVDALVQVDRVLALRDHKRKDWWTM